MSDDLPRQIKPEDLLKGQHISVRHDYSQTHSSIYEGVVTHVYEDSVMLKDETIGHVVINQPHYDVTLTLLADPEPEYEYGQLADVIYGPNIGKPRHTVQARCFWDEQRWWRIPSFAGGSMNIHTDEIIEVIPLRIAGPKDILIPVSDNDTITMGGETQHVHGIVDDFTGGLGGDFYTVLARMFCDQVAHSAQCCPKHKTHAKVHDEWCVRREEM